MIMDIKIRVKTNKGARKSFVAYFGFYDYEMDKAGDAQPYRHVDGDEIEYEGVVDGYVVTVKNAYDLTNGRYLRKDELDKLKIMYVEVNDDYKDPNFEVMGVQIEGAND